jgi:PTH1 family peptidyl-tRNA hydrolase
MLLRKPNCDWLIVGLGNPGSQYARSRHNVGFRTATLLAERLDVKINRAKFSALSAMASVDGQKVLLLLPQTFMNLSGQAVGQAAAYYKLPPERVLLLSDDISLPVGRIRVRAGGSAGGHNGIKSVLAVLGSQEVPRVKVGVGAKPSPEFDLADWVLSSFSAQEELLLAPCISRAADAALEIVHSGIPEAMNRYNGA